MSALLAPPASRPAKLRTKTIVLGVSVLAGSALALGVVTSALNGGSGLSALFGGLTSKLDARSTASRPAAHMAAAPQATPPVLELRPISPTDAVAWNASVPISRLPNPVSPAFRLPALPANEGPRALDCMTAAVFYEAASESTGGQRAVAQVVLNRLRHPAYPKTVCGVVFQGAGLKTGCQFTFVCDGSLERRPSTDGWLRARQVAAAALAGYVEKSVGGATHYHTVWVAPYWSGELVKVANIGAHIFYRWDGGWTLPRDGLAVYAGSEPDVVKLYGVGAAPFTPAQIQVAILEAPVPSPHAASQAPQPSEVVVEKAAVTMTTTTPDLVALPQVAIQPLAMGTKEITGAIGEIRRNQQVPLPKGW